MQHILEPGTVLRKRYEIRELVGRGGMGAVYKANDLRLEGRVCAIKEVLPALSSAPSEEERQQISEQFRMEASTLARLDHPNLPKVSDYFACSLAEIFSDLVEPADTTHDEDTEPPREYLVMDFVKGRDLQTILQEAIRHNRFLFEQQVLAWLAQLLDAIEYLHDQDPAVLHRDIKPSNIKVTPRGVVKLVDFGLVKVLQPDDSRTVTVVQGRGTVAYTPLEQYGGDTGFTDIRSDIYSLGATLYHLLTGEPPVDAKERFLRPGCLPPVREVNSAVSRSLERAIFQTLAMHPSERPANIREVRALVYGTQSGASTPSAIPSQRPFFGNVMQNGHPANGHPGNTHPGVGQSVFSQSMLLQSLVNPHEIGWGNASWAEVFQKNRLLLGTALGLLMIAVIVSIL
ncbi:MAG: serine/threonine-protein kinase [Chloroflexota bacterium]